MSDSIPSKARNVLVVDSQTVTAKNTAFLLELAGCTATVVKGIDEAINVITAFYPDRFGPAIILIDSQTITRGLRGMIDLLRVHSPNSSILILDRTPNESDRQEDTYRVITTRHLLREVRKTLKNLGLAYDHADNFLRFHSC